VRRSLFPLAALAASLILTCAAAALVATSAKARDDARFDHAVTSAQDRIEERFDAYLSFLLDTTALFSADQGLDSASFARFIEKSRVQERYPGVQAVAFARAFARSHGASVEAELNAAGDTRGIWPDKGRPERSAVLWIEPRDVRNREALGFDMLLEPVRSAAMKRARDEGLPALTGKLKLVQEIDPSHVQAGFIIYVPVFARGPLPAALAERQKALIGWVAAVFRADDLFRGMFGHEAPLLDFQVFDGITRDPAALLHDREVQPARRARSTAAQLELAGRTWTVVFTATPSLLQGPGTYLGLGALAVGMFFSVVIFLIARREVVARMQAEGALAQIREADGRKDEFLAVLGHELRNPLAPMLTAIELQKLKPQEARLREVVERQARHMVRLVDDLLDVSRISRGKIELRKTAVDAGQAIQRAAEALAPLAAARNLELTVAPPEKPVVVNADPTRFDQIVSNLLSNAIKYTPDGGSIEVSARAIAADLELRVRDSGIGIPPEMLNEMFEPFVQVRGARDVATGGLGIGLALVRGLAELHGGSVRAQSAGPGKGAEFIVRLPGAREGEASVPAAAPPAAAAVRDERVLVIDDNVDAAETLAEALRMDGHEVRVAHDGETGVSEARAFSPSVVFLDIGLPGASGYEVVRDLRALPQTRTALIAALTGFGQASDRERALQAGFDEHLTKPVELAEVRALVERRLADSSRSAAGGPDAPDAVREDSPTKH
jgi:signal transduction histidine kinase/ActR/RegA family two-component response regulator